MSQKENSIKFLYSYGGKIVPRRTDGKLRYVGGFTRVLSVDRFISCSELLVKFGESCGSSMNLKCKLPTEDLDVLVSVKSDEELRLLIEEYERVSPEEKIRAVLFPVKILKEISPPPVKVLKKISPPSSPVSCFDFPSVSRPHSASPFVQRASAPFVQRYKPAPPCAPLRSHSYPVFGYPASASAAAVARHSCCEASCSRHHYHVPLRRYSH